jgi:hypothetical protein
MHHLFDINKVCNINMTTIIGPQETALCTHFIGGWVDPKAALDDMEK